MYEKCLLWLIIIGILVCLWFISRKRFNQVMLVGGLSFVSAALIRLVQMRSDVAELETIGIAFGVLALLYGLVWLVVRSVEKDRESGGTSRRKR